MQTRPWEGFIRIVDRSKRFAKIAGEMVSMASVERLVSSVWPDSLRAVVNLKDPKKGERLVLLTENPDARVDVLRAAAKPPECRRSPSLRISWWARCRSSVPARWTSPPQGGRFPHRVQSADTARGFQRVPPWQAC